MADIQANIGVGVDISNALASIRQLQREISAFHTSMAKGGALANAESARLSQNLINTINAGGKFSAGMSQISSSTESFTNALEKNKLSMSQYFRYAGGASKSFGKMFSREFDTINRVATERVKDLQTQYISMGRDANGALQAIKVRPLALDMNDLGTKVQMVAQKQQIFNQLLKQGSTNLLNFGKNTQWAGRQLMVGFTIPLTIFGTTAAREFQKLEEQAVKFRRVYGDMFTTDAETEKALSNIRELADEFTKYGIAVEKTVGLAAKVAQMGNVGEDLTAQVTQATRLAVLGGLEQEEALDTTISLTNAFGVAAEDLAGKIAFLNAAENQTILAIEDFNEAIPKAGSVVQQLGGDVEDLAFMLTAMREGGISASQAANAIKSSLGRMINPTNAAKEKLASFGIDIVGIVEKNVGDLNATVTQLGYALDGLDPLNRARAIETLFGKFQFARMSTMFSNIVKEGSQANRVLQLTTNSTEELAIIAERELKRVEESPAFKLQKQMEQLRAALAPIGGEFIKAVTPIIEFGTKVLKSFNNLSDGTKQFIVAATAIGGVVAPAALMAFGLIANGVANLVKFISLLMKGFMSLTGSSKVLGTSTEYMTQQQIEAAAVAASLGQSHNNLIQVFSVEAAAIRNLTNAYRQALLAQGAFIGSGAAASGMQKPKGYATGGIVRGPGTGTSDSIVAMLSDGEAIIPADQVEKHRPIVQQLIAGDIPGFSSGGVTQSGRRTYGEYEVPIYGEYMGRFEPRSVNQAGQAGVPRSIDVGAPMAMRMAEARGLSTTPAAVSSNPTAYQDILEEIRPLVEAFIERLKVHLETTYAGIENATDKMRMAWEAAGQDVASQVAQIPNEQERLVAERTLGIKPDFYSTIPTAARNPGETQPTSERTTALLASKTGIRGYRDNARAARTLAEIETGEDFSQYDYGHVGPSKVADLRELAKDPAAGSAVTRAAAVKGKTIDVKAIQQEGTATFNALGAGLVQSAEDGWRTEAQQNSPSKKFFDLGAGAADSLANGFEQGMADEVGSPLAPPKPPQVGYMPNDNSRSGKLRMLRDKILDSAPGKFAGKQVAKLSGSAVTDSKGNTYYDPNQDMSTWAGQMTAENAVAGNAPMPVRIVEGFELSPEYDEMIRTGQINSEQLADKMGDQIDAVEENTQQSKRSKEDDKKIDRQDKAQRRGSVATKMLGGLGGLTMAAGMATQMGGVVGETAQAVVGPLAALTGILPTIVALGPIFGTLAAVIGAGIALWVRHNSAVKKARTEAYELARAMGAGKDAIQKFADFSGRVTSGEIATQRRANRQSPLQLQPGQKTFGSAFIEGESGQAMVENTRKALQKLGEDSTIQSLYTQLGTAVTQGALSSQEAVSIASALSQELGDYSIGMQVNAKLIELLGPNGENVLTEPLKIETQAKLMEDSLEASADTLNRSFQNIEMLTGPTVSTSGYQDMYVGSGNNPPSAVLQSETGQALVEAEYQRRLEEIADGPAGWWDKFWLNVDKNTGQLAEELRAGAISSSMGIFANNLEQSAMAVDAQRLASQNLIDEAIKNGATESELATLKQQEADAIDALMNSLAEANKQLFTWWNSLPESDRIAERKSQEDRIVKAAEERGLDGNAVKADLIRLQSKTGDKEEMRVNMIIRSSVESGALNETQLATIVDDFNDPKEKEIISELILGVGPGETGNLVNFLKEIDDEQLQTDILMGFDGKNTEDTLERISDLDYLFKTSPIFDGVEIPIDFFTTGKGDLEETMDMAERIRNLAESGELFNDGEIDMGAYADAVGEDVAERAKIAADSIGEEFDALDEAGKLEFFTNFAINAQFTGDPAAIAFYKSKSQEMGLNLNFGTRGSKQEQAAADRVSGEQIVNYIAQTRPVNAPGTDEGIDEGAASGAKESFDDLTVSLRNLRLASIDMKRGWDGMQEALDKVFAGGTKSIGIFDGLANQMRRVGVGEGLIERLIGMDPDEYEKRKAELFVFDAAGNIVGTTNKLKNMAAAMNAVALGEYVNQQQSFIVNTKNQFSAVKKLTAAGLSFAEAFKIAQDQATATAIAMSASKDEVKEIIELTKAMTYYQEQMRKESDKAAAADSVKDSIRDYNEKAKAVQKLSREQGKFTDAQITAILNDPNLTKLYLNPNIDPKSLQKALRNAENQANLEVSIAVSTEQGKEDYFNQMMGEINDAFAQQENAIQLKFNADNKENNKIIKEAQNAIATIQYEIDDYEAQLRGIEDQEQAINDRYSERSDALDEVAKANERINQAQQAQLNIADALSRGDIAAAARAQQELRAQQASDAEQTQRDMLEKKQAAEIAAVRSTSGQSREQIEGKVKELQDEINNIEENSLEPAQERIRIAEYNMQLQVDALEVSGKTRDEWDNIASLTGLAADNTEAFATSVERALGLYEYFVNGVALDKGLFPDPVFDDTTEKAPKVPDSTGSGGTTGGGGNNDGSNNDSSNADKERQRRQLETQLANLRAAMGPWVTSRNASLSRISKLVTGLNAAKAAQNIRAIEAYSVDLAKERNQYSYLKAKVDNYVSQINSVKQQLSRLATGGMVKYKGIGGMIPAMAVGGMFKSVNTDTVPAMLTAGEYVVRKSAVQNFGVDNLEKINNGTYRSGSVYNYNLAVNVKSDADPNKIARTVMTSIKQVEGQRIRGNRL